jgi:hypothetical protein
LYVLLGFQVEETAAIDASRQTVKMAHVSTSVTVTVKTAAASWSRQVQLLMHEVAST